MEEISLRDLVGILRKWLWLIIVLFVAAIIISGVISFYVLEPEYQTFTTLMVGKPKDYRTENTLEYNEILLNQKLVSTYGELVKSRAVADRVIDNLKLDLSYKQFTEKVNVNLVKDTEIIKLQVTDRDPALAAEIADETAEVFMDTVRDIMKVENVQVIDKAQLPENPIKPRPMLNMAIAGVLGLMMGVFFAFLMEYLDNTIKTKADVERHLNLPVLGAIPVFDNKATKLISLTNPKSPVTEAFRTLRTNIQFSSIDEEIRTLVITSSTPTEGKSVVTNNMAAIMAQGDKKVLLIDGDLRKPRIHEHFKLSNHQGLTNILVGDKDLKDVVNRYAPLDNLYILTSGPIPPNPAEILGSKKMKDFLNKAKEDYDIILIDTPPIGLVTDSAVLSTICDALIYVVAVGQTEVDVVKHSKDLLDTVNANIIGVVLNKVPVDGRSYYKYYNYYGYYEEEVKEGASV